jgi:hypothetical protein
MFNFILYRGTNRRWVIEGGSWPIFSWRSLVDVKLSKLTGLKSVAPVHLLGSKDVYDEVFQNMDPDYGDTPSVVYTH